MAAVPLDGFERYKVVAFLTGSLWASFMEFAHQLDRCRSMSPRDVARSRGRDAYCPGAAVDCSLVRARRLRFAGLGPKPCCKRKLSR